MSHIGFSYTYCVLCADVLNSVFKTCDFCVLTFEFHVLSFPFCVICFENCDFLFRRRNKEVHSKCADAEMEKERVQRD